MQTEKAKSSHFDRTRGFKNQIFPTLVISLWAMNSGFSHHALDNKKYTYLGVIWGCYSFYICLKLAFYIYLHPWSILIKNALSTKFALATKICQKNKKPTNEEELKDIDGGKKNIIMHSYFLYSK